MRGVFESHAGSARRMTAQLQLAVAIRVVSVIIVMVIVVPVIMVLTLRMGEQDLGIILWSHNLGKASEANFNTVGNDMTTFFSDQSSVTFFPYHVEETFLWDPEGTMEKNSIKADTFTAAYTKEYNEKIFNKLKRDGETAPKRKY